MLGLGGGEQHGMVADGMEAKDGLGLRRFFDAQALGADGHAPVAANLDGGAYAPDIIPPGAAGRGPQDGAFFLTGLLPCPLRGLPQFAMDFVGVAMRAEVDFVFQQVERV